MAADDLYKHRSPVNWQDGANLFKYTELSKDHSAMTVWKYPGNHTVNNPCPQILETGLVDWLTKVPPKHEGYDPVAGLRLIVQKNDQENGQENDQENGEENGQRNKTRSSTFPLKSETLSQLLEKWEFPVAQLPWISTYIGGCSAFVVGSNKATKINFVLGGGIYKFSIAGIFSYDCLTNITSGLVISGSQTPRWADAIPAKFLEMPHPMTIVLVMAEALMEASIYIRRDFSTRINAMEFTTERRSGALTLYTNITEPSLCTNVTDTSKPISGPRSLAVELSQMNRLLGITRMTLERSRLHLDFAVRCLEPTGNSPFEHDSCLVDLEEITRKLLSCTKFMLSAIDYMKTEHQNAVQRIQSQHMIISNLIAQQDVNLSIRVARDSKELAAASRKDSSAMRIIAFLTTIFLPGAFTAAFLSMPLMTWDASAPTGISAKYIWIYFAIAAPLTVITVLALYTWLRWQKRKDRKWAKNKGRGRDLESGDDAEGENE